MEPAMEARRVIRLKTRAMEPRLRQPNQRHRRVLLEQREIGIDGVRRRDGVENEVE